MDREQLSDAIGNIKDEHLDIMNTSKNRHNIRILKIVLSVAAVLILAVTAVFAVSNLIQKRPSTDVTTPDDGTASVIQNTTDPTSSNPAQDIQQPEEPSSRTSSAAPLNYAVAEAVYPETADNLIQWRSDREEIMRYNFEDGKADSLAYTRLVLSSFLSDADKNTVFSPLSLYFSLASLAEISGGQTRTQILKLLGAPSLEALRTTARAMWLNVYVNGSPYDESFETEYVIPSNSFWLNSGAAVTGDASVAEILKNDYFTSFYKGDPLDDNFQNAYRTWLDEHTGGLLKDAVSQMRIDPSDVFSLVNTLYMNVTWTDPFSKEDNTEDTFYGINGETKTTFMHQTCYGFNYYKGTRFSSAYLPTNSGAGVFVILPDEDTTLGELIKSEAYMELLEKRSSASFPSPPEGYDMYEIHYSVPKFNVTSSYDLEPYLRSLGVTDVFDEAKAEIPFIKSTDDRNLFITSAKQDVMMDVNEQGISAAAVTIMGGGWGDPVFYEVEMNLNRPFLMLIVSECNTPLFAAVIITME